MSNNEGKKSIVSFRRGRKANRMRPIPESRHWIAAALLALAAAACTFFAWTDWRAGEEQVRALTALQKRQNPDLYRQDAVFGDSGVWQFASPAFQAALGGLAALGGDVLTPFRILTGLAVLLYLGGMYALLYAQTKSWSVSVFVAIVSMAVVHGLGGSVWGVGSLAATTPAGLVTACAPLLALAFLRQQERQWNLVLVFGVVGLLANVHASSAANLAIVLLIVYLAQRRFRPRSILSAGGCGVAAILGALPILWYRWEVARRLSPGSLAASSADLRHAVRLAEWDALYPHLLDGVWTWLLFAGVLLVISAVILSRDDRFQIRNFATWVWCIVGAVAVTFLFQGAAQLWGAVWRVPAPVGFGRASNLVFLPLFVLLGHAVTTLFRILRGHRALARWGFAALAAGWMAPSDTLLVPRYALTDTVTMFTKEPDKPRYVQKRHEKFRQWQELCAISGWMARHSPPGAVLASDSAELRLRSGRGVLACRQDVDWLYRCLPGELPAWGRALEAERKALSEGTLASIERLAADLSAREDFPPAAPPYVVLLPSDPAARDLPQVPPQGWGRHYVLCRLRTALTTAPATGPAATQPEEADEF